ncbi:class I SAM-dependent methyltransferase [Thalassomonas actiniarum]|uniref:Class I SAM-dependent methyltransferase n=1 Tax=Thalassomonas actiniarum TaxID=485447 RepID=A0AAF0C5I0_9GAMM|nr:class I SAM-dependent methyltransferase [Thalassomonas actiniarum]WDE01573.1 class I SAM-dependent methyltransferase [Thalassomonas actiniarum]
MLKPISALLLAATLTTPAMADDFSDKIKQALKSELRSEKEKERDRNRKPVQTLEFFGIQDDMKVLELIPGRGWYTKLLAPALRDNGQLYLALGTSRIEKSLESEEALNKVKLLAKSSEFKYNESEELYDLTSTELNVKDLDAVLTFRNYHNLTLKTRTQLNESVFESLKPGGIYGVVDHTRRHMQSNDNENGRRFDPVLAIKEIQAAGFEFVDYSTLHYRPDDELRYEVGRKSVTGNTDRFTFLFKKPE